jgi:hypothetical protein
MNTDTTENNDPCAMYSRCPVEGRICAGCMNRQEPADGPPYEITGD